MPTPNPRRDLAILAGIVLVGVVLLQRSLHASGAPGDSNWILYGAAMFSVYTPLLAWSSGSTSLFSRLMLIAFGITFPVWCMWIALPIWVPLSHVSAAWPELGETVAGPIMFGGVQGLVTAIVLAFICRSFWLSVAVGLAFIPAYAIGGALTEAYPPPQWNLRGPPLQSRPFLPPIVVLWNAWVAVSMWVWACRPPRLLQVKSDSSKNS